LSRKSRMIAETWAFGFASASDNSWETARLVSWLNALTLIYRTRPSIWEITVRGMIFSRTNWNVRESGVLARSMTSWT